MKESVINCNGHLLDIKRPKVMGILNLSKDSFYSDSIMSSIPEFMSKADAMIKDGVDIIDLGAASSRPGSVPLSAVDEWNILQPYLSALRSKYDKLIISIDSYHKSVIENSLTYDINMVNDITGFQGSMDLVEFIADKSLPYIMMHKKGSTEEMQNQPEYQNVSLEVLDFFKDRLATLHKLGIKDVILDPGFGFGKTMDHNYELLRKMKVFGLLNCPLLIGISRKSMIYKELNILPAEALNGTTAIHMLALINGAKILRVHDVKEAKECIQLYDRYIGTN